ncbi:unnamed protein product [Notodromas monacha]|uniref:Uncharacterized protein n=1 Tax=Notodromas monacha TaxID=399045 RepID=A0A7R9GC92_9CRUS|nr:unnamed protein product [Notodromas monacha]CAG0915581.1 unnamed protein product [Notodromas monacha]
MADDIGDDDHGKFFLRNWEQQCIREFEDDDEEPSLQHQRDLEVLSHGLYHKFQVAATSVAQLYKDRVQGVSVWTPFQNAAGTVTELYKDGNDAIHRSNELGYALGYQKRTRDVVAWVKRKPGHIRREELISFLCGKAAPDVPYGQRLHHVRNSPRLRMSGEQRLNSAPETGNGGAVTEELLHTFQEAISVASFNAAVRTPMPGTGVNQGPTRRRPSPQHYVDLSNFMSKEFASHGLKRPAPPSPTHQDEVMDSPTHKKPRFN